jgi:hypothetical protein
MTGNDQRSRSRARRWLRRALLSTRNVESAQSPRLGSVNCIDDGQAAPYQVLDTPEDSQASENLWSGLHTCSQAPIVPILPPSPTLSPLPFGLQLQPHPQADLLQPPRPVLTARTSSNYFTPADIYGADPNIHPDGIYSNDDAASSRSSLASSTHSGFRPLTTQTINTPKRNYTLNPWTLLKIGWHKFTYVFDPQCFWKMIDMREIFFPFTWKRYITLAIIALIIGAIVVTEHFFHWMTTAMDITRSNMLPVLIIVLGLEPMMIIIILMFAKIPDMVKADAPMTTTEKTPDLEAQDHTPSDEVLSTTDHRTALVIPCHDSDHEAMLRVLASAYPHFRPQGCYQAVKFFVVD